MHVLTPCGPLSSYFGYADVSFHATKVTTLTQQGYSTLLRGWLQRQGWPYALQWLPRCVAGLRSIQRRFTKFIHTRPPTLVITLTPGMLCTSMSSILWKANQSPSTRIWRGWKARAWTTALFHRLTRYYVRKTPSSPFRYWHGAFSKGGPIGRSSLSNSDIIWLRFIRPKTFVLRQSSSVELQPYLPSRFAIQLGYWLSQVGNPNTDLARSGNTVDAARAITQMLILALPSTVLGKAVHWSHEHVRCRSQSMVSTSLPRASPFWSFGR